MKLKNQLEYIDRLIDENIIDFSEYIDYKLSFRLIYFEIVEYTDIIIELNKERNSKKTYDEKKNLISQYIEVYEACKSKYSKLLENIKSNNLEIKYSDNVEEYKDDIYKIIGVNLFEEDKSFNENVYSYMKLKLEQRIGEVEEELYRLKNIPSFYINTFSTFIGPSNPSEYNRDIFFYKDINIMVSNDSHFSVFYNEQTKDETKSALLGMIAYFNAMPYFYFTENYSFNQKLIRLYKQFDLVDMLKLRDKNFFLKKEDDDISYMTGSIIKSNKYSAIYLDESEHEMVFELYHASLKQFEPLPRCVFLYRVFEYGVKYHYQKEMKPAEYKVEEAIEYYVSKIIKHKYNPLYFRAYDKKGTSIKNLIHYLKKEINTIKKEWSEHSYLKSKSIGEIIYKTGRNAVAHGGGGRLNARYDYLNNYKHINDVNIFLELIARYIIEVLNPQITNRVEKNKVYYKNIL